MSIPLKLFLGFLLGGALLAMQWQPAAFAAGILVVRFVWGRGRSIVNAR